MLWGRGVRGAGGLALVVFEFNESKALRSARSLFQKNSNSSAALPPFFLLQLRRRFILVPPSITAEKQSHSEIESFPPLFAFWERSEDSFSYCLYCNSKQTVADVEECCTSRSHIHKLFRNPIPLSLYYHNFKCLPRTRTSRRFVLFQPLPM